MELCGKIIKAKDTGFHSTALFLDLSKAFDTLYNTLLLKKLERYWIWGICLEWFKIYIANRYLRAKVQTNDKKITKSQSYDITYGTAQGSCLSPLLFSLFINDIYLLPTFSTIILFADDMSILNSAKNLKFLKYTMEHDMILLSDWYKANQLSLNIDKTVLLKFWPN